jgi:hypothetical protein
VKLEGKVFDKYFEAYVDAHDEGERVERLTNAECRIAEFWAVDGARGGLYALCNVHRIGAM